MQSHDSNFETGEKESPRNIRKTFYSQIGFLNAGDLRQDDVCFADFLFLQFQD